VHYMDIDVGNDGIRYRLYRTALNLAGFKAKDIDVISPDVKFSSDKLDVSEIFKKSLHSIKKDATNEIRKSGISSPYRWAAYDSRSSVQPFFIDGNKYLYLANESSPVNERIYLIIKLSKSHEKIVSQEVCHLEFNN